MIPERDQDPVGPRRQRRGDLITHPARHRWLTRTLKVAGSPAGRCARDGG
jgi:hypothetical protein